MAKQHDTDPSRGRFRIQSELYSRFEAALFPPPLSGAITNRLSLLLPGHTVAWSPQLEQHLVDLLRRAGPAPAFAVLKTWLNAWCTSSRVHEVPELPCLFGCHGGRDTLQHYLACRNAWRLMGALGGTFATAADTLLPDRLLLSPQSTLSALRNLVTLTKCYQSIKHDPPVKRSILLLVHRCQAASASDPQSQTAAAARSQLDQRLHHLMRAAAISATEITQAKTPPSPGPRVTSGMDLSADTSPGGPPFGPATNQQ